MNEKPLQDIVPDQHSVLAALLRRVGGRVELTGAELKQLEERNLLWSYERDSLTEDQLLVLEFDD